MASIAELRRRLGPQLSDEELLLRATMPANLVDAMQAAGPAPGEYDPATRPVLRLIRELCARRDLGEILVEKPGFRLRLGSLA
jgi:oxaloacetate decarboxylase alpha subunit